MHLSILAEQFSGDRKLSAPMNLGSCPQLGALILLLLRGEVVLILLHMASERVGMFLEILP
jgi:hypothetical protein